MPRYHFNKKLSKKSHGWNTQHETMTDMDIFSILMRNKIRIIKSLHYFRSQIILYSINKFLALCFAKGNTSNFRILVILSFQSFSSNNFWSMNESRRHHRYNFTTTKVQLDGEALQRNIPSGSPHLSQLKIPWHFPGN